MDDLVARTFHAGKANLRPNSVRENARSLTYKESGTYNAQECGDLIDATYWPIGRLKQELDEPDDEAQLAYVSILCQEDVRIYLTGTSLPHKTEYYCCNCPSVLYLPYILDFVGSMGDISFKIHDYQ